MLDEALIAKIKGVQIRAKHLVNDVFSGEYESAFKGRGIEFEEVREYQPGDDVRTIDWNVTARSDRPFVKTFRDERELTVMFMVDVSASSRFGTVDKFKNEVAAEIAALLAYTALRNNDKVGMIIFSDHVEHYLPPRKGRGHVWGLIRDILSYQSDSKKTDFSVPLDFLNQLLKRRSIVFLLSDFSVSLENRKIQATAKQHDLIAVSLRDPREVELPKLGFIELEDAETGETVLVDTNRAALRKEFNESAQADLEKLRKEMRMASIDLIEINLGQNYVDAIVKFFRARERRR